MTAQQMETQAADRLWADYARTHDPRTREALIHQFERLAYSIANRFTQRGTDSEDLCQVARMGLVKAVDRFDPATHYRFSTFATPTIMGEIKRYFRDHSRVIHVPRGLQELSSRARTAEREMFQRHGRPPAPAELAEYLDVTEEQVVEALAVEEGSRPISLDAEFETGDSGESAGALSQCLGTSDAGLEGAEYRVSIEQALHRLSEPLRQVIRMRYFAALSQREVARQLGLSQMQVSRLEKRALGELRCQFAVH